LPEDKWKGRRWQQRGNRRKRICEGRKEEEERKEGVKGKGKESNKEK
jgi:hypothetical protein